MSQVDMPLLFRNRSVADCFLEGYPDVTVVDADGNVLARSAGDKNRGTFFADGPVVAALARHGTAALPKAGAHVDAFGALGQVYMNFSWYDCRQPHATQLRIDLPDNGGRFFVPFRVTGYVSAACRPDRSDFDDAFRGPFSPSGVEWPPGPDYINMKVTIDAPIVAKPGTRVTYFVTITNAGNRDYVLDPCPDYSEGLNMKQLVATYQLNCAAVGKIAPGAKATFQMELDLPKEPLVDHNQLTWWLVDGRVDGASGYSPLRIS
jgi:hypothetical protein